MDKKITELEEKAGRRSQLEMEHVINKWGSTGSTLKVMVIDAYLKFVSAVLSDYIKALNGVVDKKWCPTKDSLSAVLKTLKELDSKLSYEWHDSDDLIKETFLKKKLAFLNLFQMKLLIWDILDVRGYISKSHVEWLEECVCDFTCRGEIEDYIFDTKRSCYPFFEKKEEEEPQRKRKRSSAFNLRDEEESQRKRSSALNLQDYTLLRRKRDKKKYIQEIREEYMVLDEKCEREASRVLQFSDYLNIRSTKLDIPPISIEIGYPHQPPVFSHQNPPPGNPD
ncbi:uncharacterized protein LOC113317169 isoform X3 [Papaver somniferum]|uniref:uncharacterized protein LOC113317169 isoform X3 n=1 Tax=Papaver somniferum TaxID=3469 RepID=UPI000E6F6DDC|nr:uncharacterized protein LOC113317169 isoform X3 [Papaver somniferum]